jgi:molybdenum cofactor cytidylyltransferase
MPPEPAALILAAGRASRFGTDKRQARGPWAGPLLHHVLALYRPLFARLAVVTGPEDAFGDEACRLFSAERVINPEADLGLGRSLAAGAGWLEEERDFCAVIGLADMPFIAPATIAAVAAEGVRSGRAVAPAFQGTLGFPRVLPAVLFPRLRALSGDRGAAAVIDWRDALWLEVEDAGILADIDKPEDIPGSPS